jgi:hypothetical protein
MMSGAMMCGMGIAHLLVLLVIVGGGCAQQIPSLPLNLSDFGIWFPAGCTVAACWLS